MRYRFFSCLLMLVLSATCAQADTITNKKTELQKLGGQIQQLQQAINQDKQQRQDLQQNLQYTEVNIGELSNQINSLNHLLEEKQQQLHSLVSQQTVYQQKLDQQRQKLALQIRAAYRLGQLETLKVLFNQQDPSTLSRYLAYHRYISQARFMLIEDIKKTLSDLNDNAAAINQHQSTLQILLTQKQMQQNTRQTAQQTREKLLLEISQRLNSRQQQLETLLANQKALQNIVNRLQMQPGVFAGQPFAVLQGKLKWPVVGKLKSSFGSLLDVGDQRLTGVVISATEGAPIRAIYDGQVVFADWLRGFGLLIIVNHGNGYMSLYARNHSLSAKVGDNVRAGDEIATTGNSGGFAQPGLYFEIRRNGTPVNPAGWCT